MIPDNNHPSSADGPPLVAQTVAEEDFDVDLMATFLSEVEAMVELYEMRRAGRDAVGVAKSLYAVGVLANSAEFVSIEFRAEAISRLCRVNWDFAARSGYTDVLRQACRIDTARLVLFGLPTDTSFVEGYFHG